MGFRYKALEDIQEKDLLELITEKVSEEKALDYKRELPGGKPEEKREFLADVSSFANAAGGHLIFGMNAKEGVPTGIDPIKTGNPDDDILRLQEMILHGIRPRIMNVEAREIPISTGGNVIVVRIPKSWSAPHMVWRDKSGKFFSRTSKGKHQLDVDELRIAFMLSETLGQTIREFRKERIQLMLDDQAPVQIQYGPILVLHLLPIESFGLGESIDIKEIIARKILALPMRLGDSFHTPNFDGYLTYSPDPSFAYTQVFRNGRIEAIRVLAPVSEENYPKDLDGEEIERLLLNSIPNYLKLQKELGINSPVLILISLLRIEGYSIVIQVPRNVIRSESGFLYRPIDRPHLLIPEITVGSFSPVLEEVLKQAFHTIWNASGWTDSPSYDDKGKRRK